MSAEHHPTERELFRHANGIELEDGDRARVAAHLAVCPPCDERVRELTGVVPRLREPTLAPDAFERLRARTRPRRPGGLLAAAAVAALAGLLLLPGVERAGPLAPPAPLQPPPPIAAGVEGESLPPLRPPVVAGVAPPDSGRPR